MIKVHFTELQDQAVRGPLQRGLRYAFCHSRTAEQCGSSYDWETGEHIRQTPHAEAYEAVLASNIEYHSYLTEEARLNERFFWTDRVVSGQIDSDDWSWNSIHEIRPIFFTYSTWRWNKGQLRARHASDAGLWDVPGVSYQNNINYVLDVHALLRKGIVLDLTPR